MRASFDRAVVVAPDRCRRRAAGDAATARRRHGPGLIDQDSVRPSRRATMARRLTPKGARRRRDLMDYAARAVRRGGYHTTSVDHIVNGLRVGKGVFYGTSIRRTS